MPLSPDDTSATLRPWQAEVYAYARQSDGTLTRFLLAQTDYTLPARYILMPQAAPTPRHAVC